jgi:hypothetical protein
VTVSVKKNTKVFLIPILDVFSHLDWIFPDLTPIHDKDEECEKEEEEPEDDLKDGENASLFKNKKFLKMKKTAIQYTSVAIPTCYGLETECRAE